MKEMTSREILEAIDRALEKSARQFAREQPQAEHPTYEVAEVQERSSPYIIAVETNS
jgi:hypothetical protein